MTSNLLGDGTHVLTATQTDAAGNLSGASAALALVIDTNPPAAPSAPALAAASDGGVVGDNITNVTTPTLTGTGTAGDTIDLLEANAGGGTTIVGITTVAADGTWSVSSSTLAAGTHSLIATDTDEAGNVSAASPALDLVIDTAAPAAPMTLALGAASDSGVMGDGITNVTTPTITGTGTAGDTVTLYDGNAVVGTGTVAGNGTWAITSSALPAGTDSLTATQTDIAGNLSAVSTPLTLQIDTVTPSAPSNLALASTSDSGVAGDDITNVTSPTLTGIGVAGDTVTLLDVGAGGATTTVGTGTVARNGTWSIATSTLAAGANNLTATQADIAGNVSVASGPLRVTIDTARPAAPTTLELAAISDSGVQGDDITNVATPTITGSGTAGDTVILSDTSASGVTTEVGTAKVAAGGTWSIVTARLAAGANNLTATQTDIAGNVSAASSPLALTIETATPGAPANLALASASDSGTHGDDITNVTTPTITGTGTAGDTVTLQAGGTALGTATVAADGTWSVTTTALAAGRYNLTATETDVAGNGSAASTPLGLTIETATPAAPSGLTISNMSIDGTAPAGDTVTISEDGQTLGATRAANDGSFAYMLTPAEATGLHDVSATATDVAGNSSAAASLIIGAYHWASPVSGVFSQSGEWLVNGAPTTGVPSASTDLAYFDTGSAGAYTVSGDGNAGEVRVDGDHVTYSGTLVLAGLQDSAAGGGSLVGGR